MLFFHGEQLKDSYEIENAPVLLKMGRCNENDSHNCNNISYNNINIISNAVAAFC